MSDEKVARNLMDIVGALTSIGYIWSGLGSVGTDHGVKARAEAAGRKN